jgi:hypothetical protein
MNTFLTHEINLKFQGLYYVMYTSLNFDKRYHELTVGESSSTER